MKIGISFDPPDQPISMFSNGIRQNGFYFMELLLNCGYDVYLIVSPGKGEKMKGLYGFDDGKYKWIEYEKTLDFGFDIVVQFVFQIDAKLLKDLKEKDTRVISYNCGNEYIITMEEILYNKKSHAGAHHVSLHKQGVRFDEIWSIPQMVNTNLVYWKTLYRCDVKEVPFIWSPLAIEQYQKQSIESKTGDLYYHNRGSVKKLGIFEPNLNVFKWCFPALLGCENAYREDKESIGFVYMSGVLDKKAPFDAELLNQMVKPLDLWKDGKLSIESRYNLLYFMYKYCDIAVSFQHENPLNYLYLDLAWMGWPIVHNAHLCKDIGYYYDGFNYEESGKVILDVIKNHDSNSEKYLKQSRKTIDRYLPTNKKLQKHYKKLISDLLKKKVNK